MAISSMSQNGNAYIFKYKQYNSITYKLFLFFCKVNHHLINLDYIFLAPFNFYLYKRALLHKDLKK